VFIYVLSIALKELNCLTTRYTFSLPGGAEVTYTTGVRKAPRYVPGFGKKLLFNNVLSLCFYFVWSKTRYMSHHFVIPFAMLGKLTILQNLLLIIRVSRYIPSILKKPPNIQILETVDLLVGIALHFCDCKFEHFCHLWQIITQHTG